MCPPYHWVYFTGKSIGYSCRLPACVSIRCCYICVVVFCTIDHLFTEILKVVILFLSDHRYLKGYQFMSFLPVLLGVSILCIGVLVCACTCVCIVCMSMYACMCMYVYACACVCVCVHVRVCVHVVCIV